MKKMMKLFAVLAAFAVAFIFAACDNVSDDDSTTQTDTTAQTDTPTDEQGGADGRNDTTQTDGITPTAPTDPANPSDPATPETPAVEIDPPVLGEVVVFPATQALDYIANMTESGTVRVTGVLTNDDLNTLRTVLQEKGSEDSDVRIALDLSAATVTDGWFSIGYAPSLVSLSLPRGLGMVGIMECPSLVSLTFPDDMDDFGDTMIDGCDSLQSVTLGKGTVERPSFLQQCPALTEIKLSDAVTDYIVEDNILYTADKKTLVLYPRGKSATTFAVPDGVEKIGVRAFAFNANLTRVTMPSSVTTMENLAFSGCSALETVVLSDALTSIGFNSFSFCEKLAAITIPKNVVFICAGAFDGCTALSRAVFTDPTGWYEANGMYVFSYEEYTVGNLITISDAETMAEKLKNTTVWGRSLVKP